MARHDKPPRLLNILLNYSLVGGDFEGTFRRESKEIAGGSKRFNTALLYISSMGMTFVKVAASELCIAAICSCRVVIADSTDSFKGGSASKDMRDHYLVAGDTGRV